MLVLGYKQRHQYVDVEKTDQGLRVLFAGTVGEAVNVFDQERGSSRTPREDRHTALEGHVCVCDPPKQGFDELVDVLGGLASKIGKSFFQRGVHGDRSVGHTSIIVPRHCRKGEL